MRVQMFCWITFIDIKKADIPRENARLPDFTNLCMNYFLVKVQYILSDAERVKNNFTSYVPASATLMLPPS